jgi:hypothetical protein
MSVTINHQTNDISATGGSLTIDGAAVGGGGGVWNLISTTTVTSDVSSVNFTGLTDYDHYVAVIDKLYMSNSSRDLEVQILDSGTPDTTSYRWEHYYGSQGSWTSVQSTNGSSIVLLRDVGSSDELMASASINISGLNATNRAVVYSTGVSQLNATGRYGPQIASGSNYGNGAVRNGVRFKATSGSISGGVFALYGISN